MGIHSAPFVFTRVTQTILSFWRNLGFRVLGFLDDFASADSACLPQTLHARYMLEHLLSLGWVIQTHKLLGVDHPLPVLPALGTLIFFPTQTFILPPDKVATISTLAAFLLPRRKVFVRHLSRLAGLLLSASHCLGPATRIHTRAMYQAIESRLQPHERALHVPSIGWNRAVSLTPALRTEFRFWLTSIQRLNGQPILRDPQLCSVDISIHTDASALGWGGLLRPLRSSSAGQTASGSFTPLEQQFSSNLRELLAVQYTLSATTPALHNARVILRVDNMGAAKALGGFIPDSPASIFGGSSNPAIQRTVLHIESICLLHNIELLPLWIPRSQNSIADFLSRPSLPDPYGYRLCSDVFSYLDSLFGPHTIDRFASFSNVLVSSRRYNSLHFEPAAESTNAFLSDWAFSPTRAPENNWVHPPYQLVSRAAFHLLQCRASGTLICPRWRSAHWWPFIHRLLALLPSDDLGFSASLLVSPPTSEASPASVLPHGRLLALRFGGIDLSSASLPWAGDGL